jgi:stress response protein YsnF
MNKTVVALYDDFASAEAAVKDLADSGFSRDDISLVANDTDREARERTGYTDSGEHTGRDAAKGAGAGAAVGGIGGLLVGLAALAIPGAGPVLAAGPLGAALVGAGVGAVAGGLIGALTDMGVPEEDARHYSEGVRRGGTLVAVAAPDTKAERAIDIMERHRPVDIEARARQWRSSGWAGYDENAAPYSADQISSDREQWRTLEEEERAKIPEVEEEVRVGKRDVERGRVRVHSRVTETPVSEQVTLHEERAEVTERPVDRPATEAEKAAAFQGGTIEVTEHGEEAVSSKETRVTGEVDVSKQATEHTEQVRDTVRKTEVEVEDEAREPEKRRGHGR